MHEFQNSSHDYLFLSANFQLESDSSINGCELARSQCSRSLLQIVRANAEHWTDPDNTRANEHRTHFRLWNKQKRRISSSPTMLRTMNGTVHLLFYNLKRQQPSEQKLSTTEFKHDEWVKNNGVGSQLRHRPRTIRKHRSAVAKINCCFVFVRLMIFSMDVKNQE